MKGWNPIEKAGQGSMDALAVLVAAVPIVYRVGVVLKELQPDIRDWLQASTRSANASAAATLRTDELIDQIGTLTDELRRMDEKTAARLDSQDQALIEVLHTLIRNGTDNGSQDTRGEAAEAGGESSGGP